MCPLPQNIDSYQCVTNACMCPSSPVVPEHTVRRSLAVRPPSQPSVAAVRRSRPSQPSVAAVRRSRPSQPSVAAVRRSRPSQPSVAAVRRSRPSQPSVAAVRRSRPLLPSVVPVRRCIRRSAPALCLTTIHIISALLAAGASLSQTTVCRAAPSPARKAATPCSLPKRH